MADQRPVILIVDDDELLQEMLSELLQSEGYAVECASTAAVGRERAMAGGIDLVLLDLNLPDVNGIEVCQQIRATWEVSNLPVVVISAWSADAWLTSACYAGADEYMIKPLDMAELLSVIRRLHPRGR